MAVTVLADASGVGDNNTNPLAPPTSGTGERYWLICVKTEGSGFGASVPSDITVSGTTPTTLGLITSINGATMDAALYGCLDADIGTNPSTANGSLTYNADGTTPGSTNVVVMGIVLDGVDQATPYTNVEDDGWSRDSTNSTQNCPFTLDEIIDGLGVAFVACSKTSTAWTLTDNGYAANGLGQWVQGTNTSGNCATKSITATALNQTTTFTSGSAGNKTSTMAIMLLSTPPVDTTPDQFSFTDLADQSTSTIVESNIITITGIAAPADISVVGGEFRINGGSYTSTPTTVSLNDTVQLRVTTSVNGGADTPVTLTVDVVSDEWNVVTGIIGLLDGLVEDYSAPAGVQNFVHALGNTSSACYKEDTAQVAVIRNGARVLYLYELGNYSTITKTIDLTFDGLSDCEGICDMGNGEFAICAEDAGRYSVHIFDWPAGTTAASKQNLQIAASGADNNSGAEDLCFDRANKVFYVVGEGEQASTDRKFYRFVRPTNTTTDYIYTDPELTVTEPFNAETAFNSLGATGADWDLAGMDFDHTTGNAVIASHTGAELAQINVATGAIISTLSVTALGQMEGIAILPNGSMLAVGEPYQYQEFEYSAPTLAVDNMDSSQSIAEPTITQQSSIAADSINSVQSISEPSLTQANALNTISIESLQEVSEPLLTQAHILFIDSLESIQSITELALSQAHILSVNPIESLQTLSEAVLSVAGALSTSPIESAQTVSEPTLIQEGALLVDDIDNLNVLSVASFIQNHILNLGNLQNLASISEANLDSGGLSLLVGGIENIQELSESSFTQAHVLSVDNLTNEQIISAVNLGGIAVGYLKGEISVFSVYNGDILVTSATSGETSVYSSIKFN